MAQLVDILMKMGTDSNVKYHNQFKYQGKSFIAKVVDINDNKNFLGMIELNNKLVLKRFKLKSGQFKPDETSDTLITGNKSKLVYLACGECLYDTVEADMYQLYIGEHPPVDGTIQVMGSNIVFRSKQLLTSD